MAGLYNTLYPNQPVDPSRLAQLLTPDTEDAYQPMQLAAGGLSMQTQAGLNQLNKAGYGNEYQAPQQVPQSSYGDVSERIRQQKALDDEARIQDQIRMYQKTRPQLNPQQMRKLALQTLNG